MIGGLICDCGKFGDIIILGALVAAALFLLAWAVGGYLHWRDK